MEDGRADVAGQAGQFLIALVLDAGPELLGPEEKAVLRSLETKVEKSLKGIPFDEAIQALSTLINQNIYLDKQSLEDLGVDTRKPVEVPANIDARSVLRAVRVPSVRTCRNSRQVAAASSSPSS